MAERKSQQKYIPFNFDPKIDKTVNNKNRRKVVKDETRIELPFSIVCTKCEGFLKKGTRFNSKKERVGKYFSSWIYRFIFECNCCHSNIILETDPKNRDYSIIEGARKRTTEKDEERNLIYDGSLREKMEKDPLAKLEHQKECEEQYEISMKEEISQIQDFSSQRYKKDYEINKSLRKAFREEKKKLNQSKKSDSLPLKLAFFKNDQNKKLIFSQDKTLDQKATLESRRIYESNHLDSKENKLNSLILKKNQNKMKLF